MKFASEFDEHDRHPGAAKQDTPIDEIIASVTRKVLKPGLNDPTDPAMFDPYTHGDVQRDHASDPGLILSHADMTEHTRHFDAAMATLSKPDWAAPENTEAFGFALADAHAIIGHLRSSVNGLVIRVARMEEAAKNRKVLESETVELRSRVLFMEKRVADALATASSALKQGERAVALQKSAETKLEVAELNLHLQALRATALEAECDKYVVTLHKIEEYDSDWMRKVFGAEREERAFSDDGLDLLAELTGLDPDSPDAQKETLP